MSHFTDNINMENKRLARHHFQGSLRQQSCCSFTVNQRDCSYGAPGHDQHKDLQEKNSSRTVEFMIKPENPPVMHDLCQANDHQEKGADTFLEELAHVEEERREQENKRLQQENIKQEEIRDQWRNLHYITLNQCLSKPWVSSYFKTIPMRIYCLPLGKRLQLKNKRPQRL